MSQEPQRNEKDTDSQYEDIEDDDETKKELKSDEIHEQKVEIPKKDPTNIPRKGYFFEHDNREDEENDLNKKKIPNRRKQFNQRHKGDINGKWTHDRFDEHQQQPKSKIELVKRYGYDIRQEKDVESIKPVKKNEERRKERKNSNDFDEASDEELYKKREELIQNSDDDDFGQRLANLRRRKNPETPRNLDGCKKQNNQNLNRKNKFVNNNDTIRSNTRSNDNRKPQQENLENSFQKMSLNVTAPKRYSSMRNQNSQNPAQTTPQPRAITANHNSQPVQQQQYQMVYQNNTWQPSFPQNYNPQQTQNSTMQIGPPPGLSIPQNQSNRQYYFMPQNDYIAAQEYAVAMAASLMSNQIFYSNGSGASQGVPSPSLSPLTQVHAYPQHVTHMQNQNQFNTRQSKAIPIVNPNRQNK